MDPRPPAPPDPLFSLAALPEGLEPELSALAQLQRAGLPVAPLRVLSPDAEEAFYRLNNLPAQLLKLFSGLDLTDPDEDDLEERAPEAQRLIKAHFLLDEFIDAFYAGLAPLPSQLRLRRATPPGGPLESGQVALKGRPALLALKNLWAEDWSVEALLSRTAATASVGLAARAVLLVAPEQAPAEAALTARAAEVLGAPPVLTVAPSGITGVQLAR
ncbi:hypothetical protein [Truepera radiovictrix]|uniref:Uncharacterized protein n=1 Tax=Truepera radiovictrix (strain DSM 17093 / CIP 108686 / LMG 22925 / RQ-24) TaxID=649638 RepID=D7CXN5_TRURR|nr:hypothetical protein [Truepera radiovictrix]ADI14637.1 conserved hypothetical protein [Truepera radiovictrix DSM 17093]WMT56813.1 hypothetical protein RCV51_12445 [Truepera radiovictrix]